MPVRECNNPRGVVSDLTLPVICNKTMDAAVSLNLTRSDTQCLILVIQAQMQLIQPGPEIQTVDTTITLERSATVYEQGSGEMNQLCT